VRCCWRTVCSKLFDLVSFLSLHLSARLTPPTLPFSFPSCQTPWCKHPFLAPNKRGDACVLPGRVDIGRHFVTTGSNSKGPERIILGKIKDGRGNVIRYLHVFLCMDLIIPLRRFLCFFSSPTHEFPFSFTNKTRHIRRRGRLEGALRTHDQPALDLWLLRLRPQHGARRARPLRRRPFPPISPRRVPEAQAPFGPVSVQLHPAIAGANRGGALRWGADGHEGKNGRAQTRIPWTLNLLGMIMFLRGHLRMSLCVLFLFHARS